MKKQVTKKLPVKLETVRTLEKTALEQTKGGGELLLRSMGCGFELDR